MFDVNQVRADFPMIVNNPQLIYFDNGATSFKPKCVIDEVVNYYSMENANIHRGDYDISFAVSKAYDDTRKVIADFIGAKDPASIVYTNGATSALNIVAFNYGRKLQKGDVILMTLADHASNVLSWFNAARTSGAVIEYIPLNDDATFDLDKYAKCFTDKKVKVVALPQVSNVMGYIYPIRDIVRIAHENGAVVCVDGAQSVPHISVNVSADDIDFLAFSSHKMLGPAGIGVLYGKKELLDTFEPLMYGGGANARFYKDCSVILKDTPEKFEAGTPCIEGVLGLNKAIGYLNKLGMDQVEEYGKELSEYFTSRLAKLDNVILYNRGSQAGIVTFNIKDIFSQDAASYFNRNQICVRSGNHCAKLLTNIIGTDDTIRASFYIYNTKEEIDRFIDVIKETTIEKCVDSIL